jgi:hypothetical protein
MGDYFTPGEVTNRPYRGEIKNRLQIQVKNTPKIEIILQILFYILGAAKGLGM